MKKRIASLISLIITLAMVIALLPAFAVKTQAADPEKLPFEVIVYNLAPGFTKDQLQFRVNATKVVNYEYTHDNWDDLYVDTYDIRKGEFSIGDNPISEAGDTVTLVLKLRAYDKDKYRPSSTKENFSIDIKGYPYINNSAEEVKTGTDSDGYFVDISTEVNLSKPVRLISLIGEGNESFYPAAGAKPQAVIPMGEKNFTVESFEWYDVMADKKMTSADTFKEEGYYSLKVLLKAKEGYHFTTSSESNLGYFSLPSTGLDKITHGTSDAEKLDASLAKYYSKIAITS